MKLQAHHNITTEYQGEKIECPFCRQPLTIRVHVQITDAEIRRTGTVGLHATFAVSMDYKITGTDISHRCDGPKEGLDGSSS